MGNGRHAVSIAVPIGPTEATRPVLEEAGGRNALQRPRQDSNLRTRLRRAMLYPLSYEGVPPRVGAASPYPQTSLGQRGRGG